MAQELAVGEGFWVCEGEGLVWTAGEAKRIVGETAETPEGRV